MNLDYDSVAFCGTPQGEPDAAGYRTYTVSMPFSEITERQNLGKGEQGIDVLFAQPNGLRYRWRTVFDCTRLSPGAEIPLDPAKNFWQGY